MIANQSQYDVTQNANASKQAARLLSLLHTSRELN